MARAEGVTCPGCGMVRAPSLAECPRCRAASSPVGEATDLGERAILDDEALPSLSSLPSRLALALIPIALCVALMMLRPDPDTPGRALSYTELGWVGSAIALAVAGAVAAAGTVGLSRLARRVAWEGQTASPFAIGALMIFGVAPLVALPIQRAIDRANAEGVEAEPPQDAACRWTEARQTISRESGTVLRVTVHALCTLPDGTAFDVDIPLESASAVQGERLVVPTWPGRYYGRLIALSAAAAREPPSPIREAPRPRR